MPVMSNIRNIFLIEYLHFIDEATISTKYFSDRIWDDSKRDYINLAHYSELRYVPQHSYDNRNAWMNKWWTPQQSFLISLTTAPTSKRSLSSERICWIIDKQCETKTMFKIYGGRWWYQETIPNILSPSQSLMISPYKLVCEFPCSWKWPLSVVLSCCVRSWVRLSWHFNRYYCATLVCSVQWILLYFACFAVQVEARREVMKKGRASEPGVAVRCGLVSHQHAEKQNRLCICWFLCCTVPMAIWSYACLKLYVQGVLWTHFAFGVVHVRGRVGAAWVDIDVLKT
jgi:hypothetical protein